MTIPIYENEAPAGELRSCPQGLYTVFETRLPAAVAGEGLAPPANPGDCPTAGRASPAPTAQDGRSPAAPHNPAPPLTRLWLVGEDGAFASLGLLEPRGEVRVLRRRLSRLDCRALPPRPAYALALPDGERPPHASPFGTFAAAKADVGRFCRQKRSESKSVSAACGGDGRGGAAADAPFVSGGRDTPLPPPPKGEARPSPWLARPDGSLIDPARRLLALPCALSSAKPGLRKISLDGRDYLVFRY